MTMCEMLPPVPTLRPTVGARHVTWPELAAGPLSASNAALWKHLHLRPVHAAAASQPYHWDALV